MDIKLKDNLNNYNNFKLLLPHTRKANNEIFISVLLRHLNFLSPKLFLTEIEMFGIKNKYLFYENINKEFLERNSYIEGPVIRGDERFFLLNENERSKNIVSARLENPEWLKQNKKNELEISIEAITLVNKLFFKNSINKSNLDGDYLEFDYNLFEEDDLFNTKVKKFRLLLHAFGAYNSLTNNDIRMYYDPVYKKFDLIFNDASTTFLTIPEKINFSKISKKEFDHINSLTNDIDKINVNNLYKDLINSGMPISKDDIIKNIKKLKARLDEIKNNANFQNSTNYKIDYRSEYIKKLKENNLFYAFYETNYEFEFCDKNKCFKKKLELSQIKKLLNQKYKIQKKGVIFLGFKNRLNKINNFKNKSDWTTYQIEDTYIYAAKDASLNINKDKKIINIFSDNSSKVIIIGGLLDGWSLNYKNQSEKKISSIIQNFKYKNINGCLSFYDIDFNRINIKVENSMCEDAVNFVRTNGMIDNILIKNSLSDGIDFDFSNVKINNIEVYESKNDCVDLSFGKYYVKKLNLTNCGDKSISIGERSLGQFDNINSSGSNIVMAIKDSSDVSILNLKAKDYLKCITMYRKKTEFSGSKLKIKNDNCVTNMNFIDNGNIILKNVF